MITGLIARLAVSTGLPQWLIKIVALLLIIGLAVLVWNLWLSGHDEEVIAGHEQGVEARIEKQGRAADHNMADRAAADLAAQSQAREEFDNATSHVPKSGLTARQRIDACNELRAAGTDPAILARAKCL